MISMPHMIYPNHLMIKTFGISPTVFYLPNFYLGLPSSPMIHRYSHTLETKYVAGNFEVLMTDFAYFATEYPSLTKNVF